MSTNRSAFAKAGAALATAGFLALCTAGVASAHVTASTPAPAKQGGYSKVTLRVPNERPDAGTVKLELTLPAEYPLASVSTRPVPGWKVEAVKEKLATPVESHGRQVTEAVRTVVWTAEPGTRIEPGQFNEFDLSVGPLPDNTEQLLLPTKQTYDSGEVVDWNAPPPAEGGEEPERPAPVLNLVASDGDDHGTATTAAEASSEEGGHATAAGATDDTARWLGGAGLAVGALGLGFGAGAVLRSRRSGKPTA